MQVLTASITPLENSSFNPGVNIRKNKKIETLCIKAEQNNEVTKIFFVSVDGLAQIKNIDGTFENNIVISPINKKNCYSEEILKGDQVAYIMLRNDQCSIYCDDEIRKVFEPMHYFTIGFSADVPIFSAGATCDNKIGISVKTKSYKVIHETLNHALELLKNK